MNSLQIDYLNALANQERNRIAEQEVAAKVHESNARSDYLFSQTQGQRLDNRRNLGLIQLLPHQIKNARYKLDLDNAMLFNTVDWWVNGGRKLSDMSNRMWNPYWNTRGNLYGDISGALSNIKSIVQLPLDPVRGVFSGNVGLTGKIA